MVANILLTKMSTAIKSDCAIITAQPPSVPGIQIYVTVLQGTHTFIQALHTLTHPKLMLSS